MVELGDHAAIEEVAEAAVVAHLRTLTGGGVVAVSGGADSALLLSLALALMMMVTSLFSVSVSFSILMLCSVRFLF